MCTSRIRALIEDQRRAEEEAMRQRQEVVAKRRENRSHVIAETLQTERDFLHSISVCFDVFHDESQGQASPVSPRSSVRLNIASFACRWLRANFSFSNSNARSFLSSACAVGLEAV